MRILKNEILRPYSSIRIGGRARIMYFPETVEDIQNILEEERDYVILGKMTNVLISDYGLKRAVIILGSNFSDFSVDGIRMKAQSGISLRNLSDAACLAGIKGLEFLNGIPGSLGGALWMNAGAYGPEMKDVVVEAEVLHKGKLLTIPKEEMKFGTRYSSFQDGDDIIVSVTVEGERGDAEEIQSIINDLNGRRKAKQPLDYPSCGSVFKRPEGHFASQLIDQCMLKGLKVGGAQVSPKHAGFIVNVGDATFVDVMTLIHRIKTIVKNRTGVELEEELQILDDGAWI
ncbi:MAG: UDP-N-acetylmuramate dehydrogenase [Tissierellia bacterium]|nr:UDP-N-acetylmuramate dehydrogenase [Tissierellia bacterium]